MTQKDRILMSAPLSNSFPIVTQGKWRGVDFSLLFISQILRYQIEPNYGRAFAFLLFCFLVSFVCFPYQGENFLFILLFLFLTVSYFYHLP